MGFCGNYNPISAQAWQQHSSPLQLAQPPIPIPYICKSSANTLKCECTGFSSVKEVAWRHPPRRSLTSFAAA